MEVVARRDTARGAERAMLRRESIVMAGLIGGIGYQKEKVVYLYDVYMEESTMGRDVVDRNFLGAAGARHGSIAGLYPIQFSGGLSVTSIGPS